MNFVKRNTVIAAILVFNSLHFDGWNNLCYFLRNFRQPVIQSVRTRVEDFAGNHINVIGLETCYEGTRGIVNVHKRPPLVPVENRDFAQPDCPRRQKINHQIKPWPWRKPKKRGQPENRRVKVCGLSLEENPFRIHFGSGIQRDGADLRIFVHQKLRGAVDAARRGEQKSLNPVPSANVD